MEAYSLKILVLQNKIYKSVNYQHGLRAFGTVFTHGEEQLAKRLNEYTEQE